MSHSPKNGTGLRLYPRHFTNPSKNKSNLKSLIGTPLDNTKVMNPQGQQNFETPEKLLEWYENEEREFKSHWLWKELDASPDEVFKKVRAQLQKSNVNPELWQKKIAEARMAMQTRMTEQKQRYQKVNLKLMAGLRV